MYESKSFQVVRTYTFTLNIFSISPSPNLGWLLVLTHPKKMLAISTNHPFLLCLKSNGHLKPPFHSSKLENFQQWPGLLPMESQISSQKTSSSTISPESLGTDIFPPRLTQPLHPAAHVSAAASPSPLLKSLPFTSSPEGQPFQPTQSSTLAMYRLKTNNRGVV